MYNVTKMATIGVSRDSLKISLELHFNTMALVSCFAMS